MTSSATCDGEDASPHSDPRVRARVGSVLHEKWTLERVLGSGGMAAVYAGRHRNGALGAVKVLHPEFACRPEVRERFLREGYAANRVEHRGAVRVLDDDIIREGPDAGTAYLVMEILEGESLEERMGRDPPLTEQELLTILDDVLAVLEAAHDHGVVHRDLKPANLFLNNDASGHGVKVLDFGLARLTESRLMTSAGVALGTPSFMAPEQASGRQAEIDARSDLFSVGATAFMVLANRGVHQADGVIELVARMGTQPAPKLRDVAPHVAESVARIVDRALEFKREDRYPSAAAMRADVVHALAMLRSGATDAAATARGPAAALNGPLAPESAHRVAIATSRASRTSSNRPEVLPGGSRGWLVVGFLAAAGVAVLVFVALLRQQKGVGVALEPALSAHAQSPGTIEGPPSARLEGESTAGLIDPADATAAPLARAPEVTETDAGLEPEGALDAAADDDEDDNDLDASHLSVVAPTRDAGALANPHPVAKQPRSAPGVKQNRPRKPRRQPHR